MNSPSLSTVVLLFCFSEEEVDLVESWVEDVAGKLFQVAVEGVGVKQFKDRSRQEKEGGAKWEAKDIRWVIWAGLEMLDLCECDVMEELDKELAGHVSLVTRKSFNSNEDGRGSNDKGIEGVNPRCQEESKPDGLRVGWGHVGRFIRGRGWEVGHGKGEGAMEQWIIRAKVKTAKV